MAIFQINSLQKNTLQYREACMFFYEHVQYESDFILSMTRFYYDMIKENEMTFAKGILTKDRTGIIMYIDFLNEKSLKKFLKFNEKILDNADKDFCCFTMKVVENSIKSDFPDLSWTKISASDSELDSGYFYMEFVG